MIKGSEIYLGSELKLNVHIEPISELSMSDYDFSVELFTGRQKTITVSKSEAKQNDKDNYIITLDSQVLGVGRIIALVTCFIPDEDFADGIRKEVVRIDTGMDIIKAK